MKTLVVVSLVVSIAGCEEQSPPCFTSVTTLDPSSSFTNSTACDRRARTETAVVSGRVVVTCRCPQDIPRDQ